MFKIKNYSYVEFLYFHCIQGFLYIQDWDFTNFESVAFLFLFIEYE